MSDVGQGEDLIKLAGVLLGGYGALLSTYNFFTTHFGRLVVEFNRDEESEDLVGTVRLLCLGRARFVEDVSVYDNHSKLLFKKDIMETLVRGQAKRIKLEKRSVLRDQRISVSVQSENKTHKIWCAT